MAQNFSEDGKYFAQISADGKLKVWNTFSNSLEQEFTPDFHLTTPCTCLHFWYARQANFKDSPTPKKKKRKEDSDLPNIILGTTSGIVLVYSIAKANVQFTIDSKTNSQINCLSTFQSNTLFSGAEQNILQWHLSKRTLKTQWKGGNEIITAILALPDKNLLTASKNIKLWNVDTKEVLKTFTGHSSDVSILRCVELSGGLYFLSGSKADRLLSCWNLSSGGKQKNAVCSYLMEDVVLGVTVHVTDDGLTSVAATNRSGHVHIYQNKLNGKCDKPIKPKTSIQVVSDTGQTNGPVTPIRIFGARLLDSETVTIGHGSDVILTFENLTLTSKKVQVLLRVDPHKTKKSKETQATKLKKPLVGEDVHYLSQSSAPVKRKGGIAQEIPMEQRLENLTLSKSEGKVPQMNNVAQLLLQGLHSKDRTLLRTAICRKDETVIRNTIKRLPVTVFEPLIAELSSMVHGKTLQSCFGALWLKHLAQVHAGVLISNPNLSEIFSKTLSSISSRLITQSSLNRLRGKLELLVPQVTRKPEVENGEEDEALLVFNDKDASESESDNDEMQIEIPSDSEAESWQEEGENGVDMDQDGSDSEDSVVMVEDGSVQSD